MKFKEIDLKNNVLLEKQLLFILKEINITETLKKEVLKKKEFIPIVMEMFTKVILKI